MTNNAKVFIYGALALVAIILIAEHRSPERTQSPSPPITQGPTPQQVDTIKPTQAVAPEIDMNAAFAATTKKGDFAGGWAMEKLSQDKTSYLVQLIYDKGTAPEQFITERDANVITKHFVQYLVNIGRDPSRQGEKRWVHITMLEGGHESPTGKPLYLALSYGVYSPLTDSIEVGQGLWGK